MSARRAGPTRGSWSPHHGEQLHQVLAGLVALLPRGPADDGEQPLEGALDVAGAEQEVGGAGLRGHVVGGGVGAGERVRAGLFGTAEHLHLAQRDAGVRVVGLLVEDRLVGGLGSREVTALERGLGGVQPRVLELRRGLDVARAPHRRSWPAPARR